VKLRDILEATGGRLKRGDLKDAVGGFSVDSRTIKGGECFVAVKGERCDGHSFVKEAFKKGAKAAIVSGEIQDTSSGIRNIVQVKNTRHALGGLARMRRESSKVKVIGVTGSNGKTTTKDMITYILNKESKVLSTPGTENNSIGVPLTLLRLKDEEYCVLEMGMNHFGEIDYLGNIVKPEIGIITNIGPSHIEGLGDTDGVFMAKTELLKHMKEGSTLIVNGDDPYLSKIKRHSLKLIRFGLGKDNDIRATKVAAGQKGLSFSINDNYSIHLGLLGRHNIYNALASISCAKALGVDEKVIRSALKEFKGVSSRLELKKLGGVRIMDDVYNANPQSLKVALEALAAYRTKGRKILVSGDMHELGSMSRHFHRLTALMAREFGVDILVTVGERSHDTYLAAKEKGRSQNSLWHFEGPEEAGKFLGRIAEKGDVVLFKGSRAARMEEAIKCFTTSSTR